MKTLKSISINITEHCNLNCTYCDHFAPIAKEHFITPEVAERDLKRLKEIAGNEISNIDLMGGEPLLHPQLTDITELTVKYFDKAKIAVFTNGILLTDMSENFWKVCEKHKILLTISKYPININIDLIDKKCKQHNISYEFYTDPDSDTKTMNCVPIDLKGEQDENYGFTNCFQAQNCVFVQEGRIYTCSFACCAKHLNYATKTNLPISEEDSLSLEKIKTSDEITKYLNKPISLCKYCNIRARREKVDWSVADSRKFES